MHGCQPPRLRPCIIATTKEGWQKDIFRDEFKEGLNEEDGGRVDSTPGPLTFVFSWRAWFTTTNRGRTDLIGRGQSTKPP